MIDTLQRNDIHQIIMKTDGDDIIELRKHLRMIREDAIHNNIPIKIIVDTEKIKHQNNKLFWSNTYIHSELDDLRQMQCDDGIDSYEIRIIHDNEENIFEINSDIDYDKIYLYH